MHIPEPIDQPPLDAEKGYKPLDFGADAITGSVNQDGQIISINTAHPEYGHITLTAAPPFDEVRRYQPQAVRDYRQSLVSLDGFGLRFVVGVIKREAWLLEHAVPMIRLTFDSGVTAECVTFVPVGTEGIVVQQWQFSGGDVTGHWAGHLSIQRSAYTQLTEGGPIEPPPVQSRTSQNDQTFALENPALDRAIAITPMPEEGTVQQQTDGTVSFQVDFRAEAGTAHTFVFAWGKSMSSARQQAQAFYREHIEEPGDPGSLLRRRLETWQGRWQDWPYAQHPLDALLRRAIVYSWQCVIPVKETACLLTDHQLLPLSWNRDSYYAARALLAWQPEMKSIVRRHLRWLFEVAERPNGAWGRAYLVNGAVKDAAFQLDQQLFPLLELVNWIETVGDDGLLEQLRPHIESVIEAILDHEWSGSGLFPTEETPADDPVSMPYHLSSHILLWHTFHRLAQYVDDVRLWEVSDRTYDAVHRHFIARHEEQGRPLFSYLTDGSGQHQFYHDANDFPLALAPVWGFCSIDNPVWRATMDFAFSEANEGGYYPGKYGGLGSVHTRAVWPLGDAQEYLYAKMTGDTDRQKRVTQRLLAAAQWDGALSEAYDPETAAVVSRHWFVWPGAALYLAEAVFTGR